MSPWRPKTIFIDIILSESQAQKLKCGLIPLIWYFQKAQLLGWRTDPWYPGVGGRMWLESIQWGSFLSDSIVLFSDKCSEYTNTYVKLHTINCTHTIQQSGVTKSNFKKFTHQYDGGKGIL